MPGPVFLRDADLTLRTMEREDLEFLQRWQNDPDLCDAMGYDTPTTADGVEQLYEQWTVENDGEVNLVVCLEHGDVPSGPLDPTSDVPVEPIGKVALFDVRDDHGELGYWLVPDYHRMGYTTRAVSMVLDHAFDTLGLHRVLARVYDYNEASQGLLDSLGFTREGAFREHTYRFGEYHDEHHFGLLAREWCERRA